MHTYIINMDSAVDRWEYVRSHYERTGIPFSRVSAVVGKKLPFPIPEYDEARYRRIHGQRTNPGAVGCYMSHLDCYHRFLQSGDPFAIIAEDDSCPASNLRQIVDAALEYSDHFDLLRLCGFHNPHPLPVASLFGPYQLAVCTTRLCGTGAYLLSRHAAQVFLKRLIPMVLPIDHAIDREWTMGLRSLAVIPLPVGQTDHQFGTTIGYQTPYKLPWYRRYWTVFPFRLANETTRIVYRLRQYRSLRKKLGQQRTSQERYRGDLGETPSVALPLASMPTDDRQIHPTRKGA